MEFPKLILKGTQRGKSSLKPTKKVWQIKTKVDDSKKEVILMTEFGELGGRMTKRQKKISNINLSSKKGISTLEKFAEEEAKKLFNRKKKEGYVEMPLDSKEEIDNEKDKGEIEQKEEKEEKENINKIQTSKEKNKEKEEDIMDTDEERTPTKISYKKYYPMLAHQFNQKKKEIKYPCFVQPKLDGVRCITVSGRLYSRNGNPFPTLEHIKKELDSLKDNLVLDGELYTDDINFEKIVGLVRKNTKTSEEKANTLKIYLNVFDYVDANLPYEKRLSNLNDFFENNKGLKYIKQVKTEECKNEKEIMEFLDKYTKEGYEGLIIRNKKGKYAENARSVDLQKLKKFIDEEFEITGYTTPTAGKEVGCVIWICKTKDGKTFNVRPQGNYDERKKLYRNGKKYIGKMLTVKYQELTNDHVPRFPVGLAIRDYE
jgi:DNA ligase-1